MHHTKVIISNRTHAGLQKNVFGKRAAIAAVALITWGWLACVAAQAEQWVAFFNHVHTNYSLDNPGSEPIKLTVGHVMNRADRVAKHLGLPAAVSFTDHNNQNAAADPAFKPLGDVEPIPGVEWSVKLGHANVLGCLDKKIIDGLTYGADQDTFQKTAKLIQAQNGIVVANHPRARVRWQTTERLGVDAIEVWNGLLWKPWDEAALEWWHALLVAGQRITAVGGSDAHFVVMPIERPMNLVFARGNSPGDVLAAVKAGRVMVLAGPDSPRVWLAADADGDGQYDNALCGDQLPPDVRRPLRFQVTVEQAGAKQRLILSDRSGRFFAGPIGEGPGWSGTVYRFERVFPPTEANFVRAEIRLEANNAVESLCNPIYVSEKGTSRKRRSKPAWSSG